MNCQEEESDQPVDSNQTNELSSNEKYSENETVINYENEDRMNYTESESVVNYDENDYNYDENEPELNYDENETLLNYEENDLPLNYDDNETDLVSGENEQEQNYDENDVAQNYDENGIAQNYDESELNCDDIEPAPSYDEIENAQNITENDVEINEKILTSEDDLAEPYNTTSNDTNNSILDKTFYDPQDDEYAQELEESLDQITSLDIIDRIEQSLMDQLQKEDPFEVCIINNFKFIDSFITFFWFAFLRNILYAL